MGKCDECGGSCDCYDDICSDCRQKDFGFDIDDVLEGGMCYTCHIEYVCLNTFPFCHKCECDTKSAYPTWAVDNVKNGICAVPHCFTRFHTKDVPFCEWHEYILNNLKSGRTKECMDCQRSYSYVDKKIDEGLCVLSGCEYRFQTKDHPFCDRHVDNEIQPWEYHYCDLPIEECRDCQDIVIEKQIMKGFCLCCDGFRFQTKENPFCDACLFKWKKPQVNLRY